MTKLPAWWSRASFSAKAGWLCATNRARTYSEACRQLAQCRQRVRRERRARPEYWYNKE